MSEILFVVEEAGEGGYTAKAVTEAIFTEGDDLVELEANIRDAVHCHFEAALRPKLIRLHFVREQLLAV